MEKKLNVMYVTEMDILYKLKKWITGKSGDVSTSAIARTAKMYII